MPPSTRAAAVLLLIGASMPARAVGDPAADKRLLEDTLQTLVASAPSIREESHLETAGALPAPPPFTAPLQLYYLADSAQVGFSCDEMRLMPGCSELESTICFPSGGGDPFGVVMAGNGVWQFAWKDGRVDPDRLAFLLAHEIGHIRLKHGFQAIIKYAQLYAPWFKTTGKALAETYRQRETARYQTGPSGLGDDDKASIDRDVQVELADAFEARNADVLNEWKRRKETEADDYAYTLTAAAGWNPGRVSGMFTDIAYDNLISSFQGAQQLSASCAALVRKRTTSTSTHPDLFERDRRIFERFYLDPKTAP